MTTSAEPALSSSTPCASTSSTRTYLGDYLKEYVARHEPDTVTEQINALCDEVDTRPDPFVTEAARRILAGNDW